MSDSYSDQTFIQESYFITRLRIQQKPTDLNNLCGILGHVDAMFVAGGSYMNDHVAIDAGLLGLITGHVVRPMAVWSKIKGAWAEWKAFKVCPRPDEVQAQEVGDVSLGLGGQAELVKVVSNAGLS